MVLVAVAVVEPWIIAHLTAKQEFDEDEDAEQIDEAVCPRAIATIP